MLMLPTSTGRLIHSAIPYLDAQQDQTRGILMTDHESDGPLLPAPGLDAALSDLVKWVDEMASTWTPDDSFEIVLTVHGTPVRGTLIPAAVYVQLTDDMIADEMEHDADAIEGDVRTHGLHFARVLAGADGYPNNIHLQQAQHLTAGGWWPDEGHLWRGKLVAVDGWAYSPVGGEVPGGTD